MFAAKKAERRSRQRASRLNQLSLDTSFGSEVLVVERLSGREALSEAFHFDIEATIVAKGVDISSLPGGTATVTLTSASGQQRYIHGRVARVLRIGDALTIELKPWPWMLELSRDCRIFQEKSVPEIVKLLAGESSLGQVEDQLVRSYAKRNYCVQYRETGFDFISRLLAESGIGYSIRSDKGEHKLTLLDDASAYGDLGSLPYLPAGDDDSWGEDTTIHRAGLAEALTSTKSSVEDYNFETPGNSIKSDAGKTGRRIYDYPARADKKADAETIASDRLHMLEFGGKVLIGASGIRNLKAGDKFTLKDHPENALNAAWLLVDVSHEAERGSYRNQFRAIPADRVFRPPLPSKRPTIPGIQTARVVGPKNKEIWTDKYGRIRVKFHWDQSDTDDKTCSCWIRVAQIWAGKGWGGFVLPRIGQEVVVSFLEGDPDRPLVTGCVYNGDNPVPYPLTAEATKTGLKTNTSPHDRAEGTGYNELMFEDKAGAELVSLTAQKDLSIEVANDRATTIDKGNDSLTLNEGNRKLTLAKGNEAISIKGTRELTVEGAETHTNKADVTHKIAGNATFKVDGNITIQAGGSVTIKAGTTLSLEAGTALSLKSGTELSGKAGTSLSMQGATMEVKGSGMGTVDGGGMLTVKGGLVKIN